jgi:glycosyltransferase involved in cell wall biosynthesis
VLSYTSFFSESGVANLALSHQRPILATTQGGLGELIEQAKCGISISSPTVQSVTETILAAVEAGPERLRQMGIEGNQFVRETRSWDFVAHQTSVLYRQLASGRAAVISPAPARPQKPGLHPAAQSKEN